MPFASLGPSPQLGLLKAIGRAAGFSVTTFHLNLDLAQRIGIMEYETLTETRGVLLGDWLFSVAAFGTSAPDHDAYFLNEFASEIHPLLDEILKTPDWLKHIRDVVIPGYLEDLAETIPWSSFRVVGFTSTFQQNTASFALARYLKSRHPDLITVFGGANFDGDMGMAWLTAVPWVDYVVVGEGDFAFPQLLTAFSNNVEPADVPGVICLRNGAPTSLQPQPIVRDLDQLPYWDFDEFFERTKRCFPDSKERGAIPFESSRGCWWGAKQHCTFCGLNGTTMTYRSKSPERVIEELRYYADRYSILRFEAVDNIVDHHYLRSFFPALLRRDYGFRFFYEIKANLTREDIRLLSAAGVESLQPGIESLSTHILQLMKKGITAINNVNTLRWARYYGIYMSWNILYGFPGEEKEDYKHQADLIRSLTHLQPPMVVSRIWIERFSPIFASPDIRHLRPVASYRYVYPPAVDLFKAAYFFDGEVENSVTDGILEPLVEEVEKWQNGWKNTEIPSFTYCNVPDGVLLEDCRMGKRELLLTELAAAIYVACSERPQTVRTLTGRLDVQYRTDKIHEILEELSRDGWMMRDGAHFLSLALPKEREDASSMQVYGDPLLSITAPASSPHSLLGSPQRQPESVEGRDFHILPDTLV